MQAKYWIDEKAARKALLGKMEDKGQKLDYQGYRLGFRDTDTTARAQIRAELDAIIAHLYGITDNEFKHILSTFPLVKEDIKQMTLQVY